MREREKVFAEAHYTQSILSCVGKKETVMMELGAFMVVRLKLNWNWDRSRRHSSSRHRIGDGTRENYAHLRTQLARGGWSRCLSSHVERCDVGGLRNDQLHAD